MFLQLALRARAGEGRRQENEPVPLIKCTEFRDLIISARVSNGFGDALRAHDRAPRLLCRAHGTWQYLEVFRILHEAWICLECCIFFVCSFSAECGRGNDDRGPMYRVSLMRLWEHTHLTNFLTFKKTNNLNTAFSLYSYYVTPVPRETKKLARKNNTSRHVGCEENSERCGIITSVSLK